MEKGIKQLDTKCTFKANITSARDELASASSNVSQNLVNTKKGKHIARSAAICLEENQASVHTDDTDFVPDQRTPALSEEINTFGKTIKRSTQATDVTGNAPQPGNSKQKYSAAGNVQQKQTLLKVTGSKEYSVRVQSDSTDCNIVSACSLEDGTIILSDCDNDKLKRFDCSSCTVTDYCDLPEHPWQVCVINKQEVAVCLTYEKEVNFISVRNKMIITNKIATDFPCYFLAYAGGNLYISDYENSVYIYSVSGRKLKQFSKDQSGQAMFSNIHCLTVNEDGSRIYVTDWDDGLIVLDNNGQVIGKFKGPQLEHAYGSYLTGRGSLLVCGYSTNNVLQFGLNGELIGEVVKSAGYTKAICCTRDMSKMIITCSSENEIDVYDLV